MGLIGTKRPHPKKLRDDSREMCEVPALDTQS